MITTYYELFVTYFFSQLLSNFGDKATMNGWRLLFYEKKKLFQQIFLTRKRSNSHVPDIIYKYDISMFDLTVTSWVKLWVQFSWSELHNKTHNSVFTDKSLINIIGFLFLTWALTSHLACMKYLETNKSSSATTEIRRPAILCWATNEHS